MHTCVHVKINKRSFEPFCVWITDARTLVCVCVREAGEVTVLISLFGRTCQCSVHVRVNAFLC